MSGSPAYLNTGLWTLGVARLVVAGGLDVSHGGKPECKDEYAFILEPGTRPVASGDSANVSGLPGYGDDHPDIEGLSVSSISFQQYGDQSAVWKAIVTYSGGENADIGDEDEEMARYTRLHIGTVAESRELTVDADNDAVPVVNSAGDPFESVPQVERHLLEIQITRNQNDLPDMTLNGSVNSAEVTVAGITIDAKCGRIKIEADRNFGGKYKWAVSFIITVNPDTWALTVLQNGYRYIDANNNNALVKFTDTTDDGRVVECSSPQLLGPEGGDGRGRGPYYATFNAYPSKSWTSLKLPASL